MLGSDRGSLHGQWSSPSLGRVGDRSLVFFGGGDGVCYAFEALATVPDKPVKLKTALVVRLQSAGVQGLRRPGLDHPLQPRRSPALGPHQQRRWSNTMSQGART